MSRLWDDFRKESDEASEITFDWFVLSLDLLFILGAVEFDRGRIRRISVNSQGHAVILRIFSSLPHFKGIALHPGINVALADKSAGSTDKWHGEERTALIAASCHGHTPIVRLLLERGADPRLQCYRARSSIIPSRRPQAS